MLLIVRWGFGQDGLKEHRLVYLIYGTKGKNQ